MPAAQSKAQDIKTQAAAPTNSRTRGMRIAGRRVGAVEAALSLAAVSAAGCPLHVFSFFA
jgi:hypothetical protein